MGWEAVPLSASDNAAVMCSAAEGRRLPAKVPARRDATCRDHSGHNLEKHEGGKETRHQRQPTA